MTGVDDGKWNGDRKWRLMSTRKKLLTQFTSQVALEYSWQPYLWVTMGMFVAFTGIHCTSTSLILATAVSLK